MRLGVAPGDEGAELTGGVEHVMLSANPSALGWYRRGVVAVCAWPRELWAWWSKDFVDEHRASLERYGVPMKLHYGRVFCDFGERQIRAFQLLRVLLHELGHHADVERGEPYANRFEVEWDQRLWSQYVARFGSLEQLKPFRGGCHRGCADSPTFALTVPQQAAAVVSRALVEP